MKSAILLLFTLVTVGAIYWWLVRPILRRWVILAPMWAQVDVAEAGWGSRIAELFRGLKTTLAAASVGLASALVSLHDWILPYLAAVDWTPFSAQVPPWGWLLITLGLSVLFGMLRKVTIGPPAKV